MPVLPELAALGHRALAVDLPCVKPSATLDDYARTVVEAMAGIAGPVVVGLRRPHQPISRPSSASSLRLCGSKYARNSASVASAIGG